MEAVGTLVADLSLWYVFSYTAQRDAIHEANMLIKVCHPYLFGICTSARPLSMVLA